MIGAIYLDGGFEPAKKFIHKFILTDIEHKKLFYDSKTILQEVVQGNYKESLHYELISEEGPDHDKQFSVEARIGDKVIGAGTGHTKKAGRAGSCLPGTFAFETETVLLRKSQRKNEV